MSKNYRFVIATSLIVVLLQSIIGWYGFLAPKEETAPECTDSIVYNSELVRDKLYYFDEKEKNYIDRIKDLSVSLNANYGYVIGRATMSSWSYGVNPELVTYMQQLGYNQNYLRTLDGGGTVFSDAFMHVTSAVSFDKEASQVYRPTNNVGPYYIYDTQYTYPFGVLLEADDNINEVQEEANPFQVQNQLYHLIEGDGKDIVSYSELEEYLVERYFDQDTGCYKNKFQISCSNPEMLYLYVNLKDGNFYRFIKDDNPVLIHDIEAAANEIYPAYFNNGLICLGYTEESNVDLVVESMNEVNFDNILIGKLDLKQLSDSIDRQQKTERKITALKDGLKYSFTNNNHFKALLLPIANAKNLEISVNGKKYDVSAEVGNSFVAISVEEGLNDIQVKYVPQGLRLGIVLCLVGCVFMLIFVRYNIWNRMRILQVIMFGLFVIIEKLLWVVLYILPIAASIITKIMWRFNSGA